MKYNRRLFQFSSSIARSRLLEQNAIVKDGARLVLDNYNGCLVPDSGEHWHAEHLVPLKSAWEMGFMRLYERRPEYALQCMKLMANDIDNLVIVGSSSNMSRGDKTLWNWSPLNLAFIPERNRRVTLIAERYGLRLSRMQKWALGYSTSKLQTKYRHGVHIGKVRSWLSQNGFHWLTFRW